MARLEALNPTQSKNTSLLSKALLPTLQTNGQIIYHMINTMSRQRARIKESRQRSSFPPSLTQYALYRKIHANPNLTTQKKPQTNTNISLQNLSMRVCLTQRRTGVIYRQKVETPKRSKTFKRIYLDNQKARNIPRAVTPLNDKIDGGKLTSPEKRNDYQTKLMHN